MITSVSGVVMTMSSLVPGMTYGVFVSNAPKYDHKGRALCDGLPTVWQKGTIIVNTQDGGEYKSDAVQWVYQGPATAVGPEPATTVMNNAPVTSMCLGCNSEQTIPEDDYLCKGCRTAL